MIKIGFSVAMLLSITGFPAALAAYADTSPEKKTCKEPELRERFSVGQEDMQIIAQSVQDYVNCMQPIIDAKRTKAQAMLAEARAQAESSNADITALNAFIAKFKEFQVKHKDDK